MYYGTIIIVPQPVSSIMATVTNTTDIRVYNIVVEWEVSITYYSQIHLIGIQISVSDHLIPIK